MGDESLYAAILGVKDPWGVDKVELRLAEGEVHIWVALCDGGSSVSVANISPLWRRRPPRPWAGKRSAAELPAMR